MAVPILPQFAPGHKFTLAVSGQWTVSNNTTFLDDLVNSLAQGAPLENVQSIDSIPHVWAKPLLFKMALFDNAKQFVVGLKEHVTGEWRALLAMLALKDVLHLNLTVSHVDLTKAVAKDIDPVAEVFRRLAPTNEALDGNDAAWVTNTYVISFKGAPIAMTSPVTLVATAADYADNLSKLKISLPEPWSNDGLSLTDPIPYLSNYALNALKFWLDKLAENLSTMHGATGANQALINNLLTCVASYITDINARIGNNSTQADTFGFVPSSLNLAPLLGGLLQNTVQILIPEPSAVELVLTGTTKKFLLVSPQMLQEIASRFDINVPLSHIVVCGGLTANHITDASLQNGHNQIGNVTLAGIEWRRPEEFFQEKMVLLPGQNVFCHSFNSKKTKISNKFTAILPIKPELAEIFSPSDLHNRIHIEYVDNNGRSTVTLTFNFPLSGINGNNITYNFKKVYSAENLIKPDTRDVIPVVEIWPDFVCDSWHNYYLHYSNALSGTEDSAKHKEGNFCFFAPWSARKDFTANMPADEFANMFTAKLDCFPEALTCTYVSNGTVIKAGIVFLKTPDKIIPKEALNWKIGIDFGTSATMLFFSQNDDDDSQPLNLKPHLYQITNSDEVTRATRTILNFIADNDELIRDGSFLSVFHLLNHHIKGINDVKPLQDGHVLLLTPKSPYLEQYANFIETNIKWDKTNKLEAYINQICMQALVEALTAQVGSIKWNFSYPLAFTNQQQETFCEICEGAVNNLTVDSEVEFHPESEALAYYFYKLGGGFLNNAICIDIGAGTTDISVISDTPGRIIFHTSIQYAGRYMFNSIYENFSVFKEDGVDYAEALTNKKEQATIDLDMRDKSDTYIDALNKIVGHAMTKAKACRALQIAHLAVAGLFYYLGKILKTLRIANLYTSDQLPQVFVGGNGSRIFKWLRPNSGCKAVLKEMLTLASEWEKDKCSGYKLTLSSQPKVEVASGMISLSDNNFYDEARIKSDLSSKFSSRYTQNAVITGASFDAKDSKHSAEDFLNETDIEQGIKIDAKLTEFATFLSAFNKSSKELCDSDTIIADGITHNIYAATCGFYGNQKIPDDTEPEKKAQKRKKISVEPVFIVELREFIKNARRLP